MKFANSYLSSLLVVISSLIGETDSHGVEVAHCLTIDGNLRIYIKSWHHDVRDPSESGTMQIKDHQTGLTTALVPDGWIRNRPLMEDLPDCLSQIKQDSVCAQGYAKTSNWNDWAYFDFPGTCNAPVIYTLIQGTTVVLENGCTDLYPTEIKDSFIDTKGPTIKINGEVCDGEMVITELDPPCGNVNELIEVNYEVNVIDDCDPNPTSTVVDPAENNLYPDGDTDITVTASDNQGQKSECNLIIRREANTCPCCGCVRRASIRPDPHYSTWDAVTYYDYQGSCDHYAIRNRVLDLQVRSRGRTWYSTVTAVGFKFKSTGETFYVSTEDDDTNGVPISTLGDKTSYEELGGGQKGWIVKFVDDLSSSIKITVYGDQLSIEAVGTGIIFCGSEGLMGSWDFSGVRYPGGPAFDTNRNYDITTEDAGALALSWKVQASDSVMKYPSSICNNDSSCGSPPKPVECPRRTVRLTCEATCDSLSDDRAKQECEQDTLNLGEDKNIFACNPATSDPIDCEDGCDTDPSSFSEAPPPCGDNQESLCPLINGDATGFGLGDLSSLIGDMASQLPGWLCPISYIQDLCQFTCGICCENNSAYTFIFEDEVQNCLILSEQVDRIRNEICLDSSVSDECPETCGTCPTKF